MIFTLVFVVAFIIAVAYETIYTLNYINGWDKKFKFSRFRSHYDNFATWFTGILLVIVLLIIPLSRRNITMQINSFEMQRATLWDIRGTGAEGYETAGSVAKAMELNDWLATGKWIQSHNGFNWYVPKEIQNVKPIQ